MAEVSVRVNGRDYVVACDDGEEQRLQDLAGFVNEQVAELVTQVGQVGEARLLLMAALMVADELAEVGQRRQSDAAREAETAQDRQAMSAMAERLEQIAARLESA